MNEELEAMLPELAFVEEEIISYKKRLKEMEERKAEISSKVLEEFEKDASKEPIENDKLKITYVKPSVRTSIDKDALQEKYPEIAKEFEKETTVKASIRIKLKEKENE